MSNASWYVPTLPTASITQSAPRPSVSSRTTATASSVAGSTTRSAPSSAALARRGAVGAGGVVGRGGDVGGGTAQAGELDVHEPHRAPADDHHGAARAQVGSFLAVDRARQWLHVGRMLRGHVIRELVDGCRGSLDVF